MEEWRPILGFEGYEASNLGRIRSLPRQKRKSYRVLRPGMQRIYHCVSLHKNGKGHTQKVHQLVLEAFTGVRRTKGKEVGHKNGIATDNRLSNLYWTSREQNEADKIKHGTFICGEKSPKAKLKEHEVLVIHRLARGGMESEILADQFGVHKVTIEAIRDERTWKHLWGERI